MDCCLESRSFRAGLWAIERKLSLTALLPRYEHCGRIF